MKRAMRRMRKVLLTVACIALVCGLAIGGTIAWLADSTKEVKNTFSPSNLDIELEEHNYVPTTNTLGEDKVKANANYVMVPSKVLPKDPFVTVAANSEECYVFVKITKSNNYDTYLNPYQIADDWTKLESASTGNVEVYYITDNVQTSNDDQSFYVLKGITKDEQGNIINENGEIIVKDSVTLTQMEATGTNKPTLTFEAYAIQKLGIADATTAWTTIGQQTWASTGENNGVVSGN